MIEVTGLTKSFGKNEVVSNLSFEVKEGEIFAFLGANGSGKTTSIRCLLNILDPDSGKLLVQGQSYNDSMAKILGYLPEERGLYLTAKVLETLVYFARLRGLSSEDATKKAEDFLERIGLADKASSEVKKLSSGQQQKIQLGLTMLHDPELLILDEPTKGLDPVNRFLLMEMLLDANKRGSTIVFITHYMEEVEQIADRLVMIKDGRRVLYGPVDRVKEEFGSNIIHVNYSGVLPINNEMYSSRAENHKAEITPKEGVDSREVLKYLVDHDLSINRFEVATPSLREIFVEVSKPDYKPKKS